MKLKEAIKLARKMRKATPKRIEYIAVDECGEIWTYEDVPHITYFYEGEWVSEDNVSNHIGRYTGSKRWSDTCRKV